MCKSLLWKTRQNIYLCTILGLTHNVFFIKGVFFIDIFCFLNNDLFFQTFGNYFYEDYLTDWSESTLGQSKKRETCIENVIK